MTLLLFIGLVLLIILAGGNSDRRYGDFDDLPSHPQVLIVQAAHPYSYGRYNNSNPFGFLAGMIVLVGLGILGLIYYGPEKEGIPKSQPEDSPIEDIEEPSDHVPEQDYAVLSEAAVRDEMRDVYVVRLKQYIDPVIANRLVAHFSQRHIQVIPMSDGTFWACIVVPDERRGKAEIKDWQSCRSTWSRLGIQPKLIHWSMPVKH